ICFSFLVMLAAVAGLLAGSSKSATAEGAVSSHQEPLDAAIARLGSRGSERKSAVLENFKFVGHTDLGEDVDFGDVWGHGNFAYVGSRCGDQALGGGGVRVVDISHPTHPVVV